MKLSNSILCGALVALMAVPATASAADEPTFMRSSIYTILVNSDKQNERLENEAKEVDSKGYQQMIEKYGDSRLLSSVPATTFPHIGIPVQFNDHNLGLRIVNYDLLKESVTPDEAKAARPKGGGAGKAFKSFGGAMLGGGAGKNESSILRVEEVDEYMHAVMQRYFRENHVADSLVAKWFNYNPAETAQFNDYLIQDRGLQNASAADIAKASADDNAKIMLAGQGYELINNTYVVAVNLRFRNNKAVVKEAGEAAGTVGAVADQFGGGGWGKLIGGAAKLGTKLASGKMKDSYSVTAMTHLYKLQWNDSIRDLLGDNVLYKEGATMDDLLRLGVCSLDYVGQCKASSGVKNNDNKSLDELAGVATVRAIDKAIAKLQVENEVFRTKVPVSKCEDGFVYAKIGSKEGLNPDDEYEILEMSEDEAGRIKYKSVGSAKVVKDHIWFNTAGADDIIALADEKEAAKMKAAQELGYTKLKANKKNDFSGYYLRLKKKKGKIE